MRLQRALVLFVALLVCVGAALFTRAVMKAWEAAQAEACRGRMSWLQAALMLYEAEHGHLPPAYIAGPDGKPWHSWRVLILPYCEEQELYDQYRFDEPWNGPNNQKLADRVLSFYQCDSSKNFERHPTTNYMVVVGEGTAFPGDQTTATKDFHDGPANTILLVEVPDSDMHWMEPRDLSLNAFTSVPPAGSTSAIGSNHPAGPAVVFADSIHTYRVHSLEGKTLRALSTIAGGEPVTRESLESPAGDGVPVLSEE